MLICKINLEEELKKYKNKILNSLTQDVLENNLIKETFLSENYNDKIIKDIIIGTIAFLMREVDYDNYKKSKLKIEKEKDYINIILDNNKNKNNIIIKQEELETPYMIYDFLNKILCTLMYINPIGNYSILSNLKNIEINLLEGTELIFKYEDNNKIKINLTYMDLYDISLENNKGEIIKEVNNLYNDELVINLILLKNIC